jgi:hypothetical protein
MPKLAFVRQHGASSGEFRLMSRLRAHFNYLVHARKTLRVLTAIAAESAAKVFCDVVRVR